MLMPQSFKTAKMLLIALTANNYFTYKQIKVANAKKKK